jgi:hypothetical protein
VLRTIHLSWTASPGALSYRVYRSTTKGSGYAQIASGITGTTYDDVGVTPETTYYYVVRAFNLAESTNSNEASALTPTPPPHVDTAKPDHPICGVAAGGAIGPAAGVIALAALALVLALRKAS